MSLELHQGYFIRAKISVDIHFLSLVVSLLYIIA